MPGQWCYTTSRTSLPRPLEAFCPFWWGEGEGGLVAARGCVVCPTSAMSQHPTTGPALARLEQLNGGPPAPPACYRATARNDMTTSGMTYMYIYVGSQLPLSACACTVVCKGTPL